MLRLRHHIDIGGMPLRYPLAVDIRSHMDSLSDWAEVRFVGMQGNRPLAWQKHIQIGTPIRIALGYDEALHEEFTGYVQSIANENELIVLYCQDQSYLLSQARLPDQVLRQSRLGDLLDYIVAPVSRTLAGVRLHASLRTMSFQRFHLQDHTPYTALAKIKTQTALCVYCRKGYVYVTPRHQSDAEVAGRQLRYSHVRHIQGTSLRYQDSAQMPPLQVEVVGLSANAKHVVGRYGTGRALRLYRPHISHAPTLRRIAFEEYKKHRFQGYSGPIETYLAPYCSYGYHAQLASPNDRPTTYFVEGVHIHMNRTQGGQRNVFLGPAIHATP